MMSQKLVSQLFDNVLSISEGTPYRGELSLRSDTENISDVVLGDVIFSFDTDRLSFSFYLDGDGDLTHISYAELIAVSSRSAATNIILKVPERNFEYPVSMRTIAPGMKFVAGRPFDKRPVFGDVITPSFGLSDANLSLALLTFKNIPRFEGTPRYFGHGILDEFEEMVDPNSFSWEALCGINLNAGDWEFEIEEVPDILVSSYGESHTATIRKREHANFTGHELEDFVSDLTTFLGFVFGSRTVPPITIGIALDQGGDQVVSGACWAQLGRLANAGPRNSRNWFNVSMSQEPDLAMLFKGYYTNLPMFRSHWRLTIDAYIESERLADSGQYGRALSISVSAIEGLVKSVLINLDYFADTRDDYLFPDDHNRKGQMLPSKTKDAIQFIFEETIGRQAIFRESEKDVVEGILEARNSMAHLDLDMPAEDLYSGKTYELWRASQALFECLMLSLWGANSIPNRTRLPKVEILGQDFFANERAGEIDFQDGNLAAEDCGGHSDPKEAGPEKGTDCD